MSLLIVGQPSNAEGLVESLVGAGSEARAFDLPPADGAERAGSSAPLARALEAIEAELEADRPTLVVLADDSDTALAAALVATKLVIEVEAVAAATDPASANARLIAQLAGPYTLAA